MKSLFPQQQPPLSLPSSERKQFYSRFPSQIMTSCGSRLTGLAAVRWGFLGSSWSFPGWLRCSSDSFRDGVENRSLKSHYDVSTEEHNRKEPVCSDARLVLKPAEPSLCLPVQVLLLTRFGPAFSASDSRTFRYAEEVKGH